MIYFIKRKIWQIKNIIKWLPIIWNQYDFDYSYAIEVFKFQLQKTATFLKSDKTYTKCAKERGERLQMIIDLMTKVYDEDYSSEFVSQIEAIYGKDILNHRFIPSEKEGYSELKHAYELEETPEKIKEITEKKHELFLKSNEKQKRAHKLLWSLVEHNIEGMWD